MSFPSYNQQALNDAPPRLIRGPHFRDPRIIYTVYKTPYLVHESLQYML